MDAKCIRCGVDSRLVFQGSGKFICTSCLDVVRENKVRKDNDLNNFSTKNT